MTTHALHDAQCDAGHDAEHDGTWATLAETASILGCSVDTVRRRIRRGELHAMQNAGRHGPTWRVLLSATPGSVPTVGSTPGATPSVGGGAPGSMPSVDAEAPALLEALRMLDAMRQENRDLAGQVGYLQARAQLLEERVRALEAPKPEPAPDPILPAPNAAPWDARWQARVVVATAVLLVLLAAGLVPMLAR